MLTKDDMRHVEDIHQITAEAAPGLKQQICKIMAEVADLVVMATEVDDLTLRRTVLDGINATTDLPDGPAKEIVVAVLKILCSVGIERFDGEAAQ